MTFTETVSGLFSNLSFSIPDLILIVFALAGIINYSKNFRIGLITHFLTFASCYLIFSALNIETTKALILTSLFLILITLSLFISHSKTEVV